MKNTFLLGFLVGFFLGIGSHATAKPNYVILGYSASWFDGIYPPVSYNFDAMTHIARAFLIPKEDGSIIAQGGYSGCKLGEDGSCPWCETIGIAWGCRPEC